MFWKRLSLAKKIFFAIALTSTLIVLIMAVMVGMSMRDGFSRYLVQAEINRFGRLAEALAASYEVDAPHWPALAASPQAWRRFVGSSLRSEAREEAENEHHGLSHPFPPTRALRRPVDRFRLGDRISLLDANRNLIAGPAPSGSHFVTRPIMPANASEGVAPLGWIGVAAPLGAPLSADGIFLKGQLWSLASASVVALLLSALAAFVLARQFLAPVMALAGGANALAEGRYGTRMENDRTDEFGTLINHFNALAESLESARDSEREWITDTSHELQTPLAVLRAEIEALQDGVRQPTDRILSGLHASVMRLSHLVNDLNTLAHTREGGFSLSLDEADLRLIIEEAADHARPGLMQAGLDLKLYLDKELPMVLDRYRMYQLLGNLLENARRYTDKPGRIVLAATLESQSISITLDDTAPCPPPAAMDRLFERFYRVEASRSRAHGGSGLGLAICRAIVKAHGGTIEAKASRLGGLRVALVLPRSRENRGVDHAPLAA